MIYYCVDCRRRVLRKEIHIFDRRGTKEIIHGKSGCPRCFGTVFTCATILSIKGIKMEFPKIKWLMEQPIPINRCDKCKHKFICYSGGK